MARVLIESGPHPNLLGRREGFRRRPGSAAAATGIRHGRLGDGDPSALQASRRRIEGALSR